MGALCKPKIKLTAEIVEAFSGLYLSPRYDQAQPTPQFHRDCWARYCSDHPACSTAAPRNHAKSTALTHDFILANVCFRVEDYIILVGSTEEMAIEHLGDITKELQENEELIRAFHIKGFVTEAKTDIIVECHDGYQFRIIARGAEQKIRGRKWRGKRPGLIVFDDIEDDEQVESKDRRRKFRKWFFRACKQALRDNGRIRGHGTILHEDSLLNRLMRNKSWDSVLYKAHASFDDFSEILWPEKFPEARLRAIRQEFIDDNDSGGYSQEYLNDPFDSDELYLRKEWFLPLIDEETGHDYGKMPHMNYCGVDFAITKKDNANRSSFTVGGLCPDTTLVIKDQRVARMDSEEIRDTFFQVHRFHKILCFFVEDGQIWKAVAPMVYAEMRRTGIYLNIQPLTPISDKAARGRGLQARMKGGGARFDKDASWYPEYEHELLKFKADAEAMLDDQFDSTVHLNNGIEDIVETEDDDFAPEEELEDREVSYFMRHQGEDSGPDGRSKVTGY